MPAPKKRIMVSLTEDQIKMLEDVCTETGLSKSSALGLALMDWIDQRKKRAAEAAK